jgi:hypothetical protein
MSSERIKVPNPFHYFFAFPDHLRKCTECKSHEEVGGILPMPILCLEHLCAEGQRLHDEMMKNADSAPTIRLDDIRKRRFKDA